MANDFSNGRLAPVGVWAHEASDTSKSVDTSGHGNTLSASTIAFETTDVKEGAQSRHNTSTTGHHLLTDGSLSSGFPGKSGESNTKFSFCVWLKPEDVSASEYIAAKHWGPLSNRCGYYFYIASGTPKRFGLAIPYNSGASREYFNDAATSVALDQWYHVGFTYNGSTKAWRIRVWDDTASSVAETTGTGSQTIDSSNTEPFSLFNAYSWVYGNGFEGYLDEAVLFNDILTADEIDEIRQGTYGASSPSASISASPSPSPSASPSVSPSAAPVDEMTWYPLWTWPVHETLVFNTQILRSKDAGADGSEQRIALLIPPRQRFATQLLVQGDYGNAEWDTLIHYWAKRAWPVPVWPEATLHTGTLSAGATTISIDTTNADWRANGKGLIFTRDLQEEIDVSAVAAGQLTVAALANTFTSDKWIIPQRAGILVGPVRKRRRVTGHSLIDVQLEVIDNQSVAGWSASMTYDGYDVLDDPCYAPGGIYEESDDGEVIRIDNKTGLLDATSHSDFNRTTQSYVAHKTTCADCWAFRQWLHAVVGRQKTFLVPTFRQDFSLSSAVGSSDTTVDVAHRDFSLWMGLNARRTYLFFWDRSSTLIVRKITGMEEIDATTERLTIDAAPGQQIPLAWVVGWVDLCRLATDTPALEWRFRDKLSCNLPLERVSA